jgi:hypothetical protein
MSTVLRRLAISVICFSIICFQGSTAAASYIIDTGDPTSYGWLLGYNPPYEQWLAAKFSVPASTEHITDIEAFFTGWNLGGTVSIDLIRGSGNIPDYQSNPITAGSFVLPATAYGWAGLYGLDIPVTSGEYWVIFRADAPTRAGILNAPPRPLGDEAAFLNGVWVDADYADLALRISDSPQVPLPGSFPLLAGGLAGLAGLRRKRR